MSRSWAEKKKGEPNDGWSSAIFHIHTLGASSCLELAHYFDGATIHNKIQEDYMSICKGDAGKHRRREKEMKTDKTNSEDAEDAKDTADTADTDMEVPDSNSKCKGQPWGLVHAAVSAVAGQPKPIQMGASFGVRLEDNMVNLAVNFEAPMATKGRDRAIATTRSSGDANKATITITAGQHSTRIQISACTALAARIQNPFLHQAANSTNMHVAHVQEAAKAGYADVDATEKPTPKLVAREKNTTNETNKTKINDTALVVLLKIKIKIKTKQVVSVDRHLVALCDLGCTGTMINTQFMPVGVQPKHICHKRITTTTNGAFGTTSLTLGRDAVSASVISMCFKTKTITWLDVTISIKDTGSLIRVNEEEAKDSNYSAQKSKKYWKENINMSQQVRLHKHKST
eukprot:jgi/Psemu1/7907/gm1.7907_g